MDALRRSPTVRNLVTVTFTRQELLQRLREDALRHPADTYRLFGAVMDIDERGGLAPISAEFDLRDARFSPTGSPGGAGTVGQGLPGDCRRHPRHGQRRGLSIQRAPAAALRRRIPPARRRRDPGVGLQGAACDACHRPRRRSGAVRIVVTRHQCAHRRYRHTGLHLPAGGRTRPGTHAPATCCSPVRTIRP